MPVPEVPQITIFLDTSGTPRAEAPGTNGSRQKIDLPLDFASANPEIMAALLEQLDRARRAAADALRATQLQNIKYVDQKHPGLTAKVWHDGELKFRRAKGYNTAVEAKAKKTKEPQGRLIDITF